jgi:hypothetical protein
MEVHHHAQHEGKKSWKSYFSEFLMLFLAVFCGSMAEYYLEHRIEKERGTQYVQTMIEDMASDSIKINAAIKNGKEQKLGLDSLSALFEKPSYNDSTVRKMYSLIRWVTGSNGVNFTKRTTTQLNNAGGMRLIPNKVSADEITSYMEAVDSLDAQGVFVNQSFMELTKLTQKIFYLNSKNIFGSQEDFLKSSTPIKLLNNDEKLFAEYNNLIFIFTRSTELYIDMMSKFKEKIPENIKILKEKNDIN